MKVIIGFLAMACTSCVFADNKPAQPHDDFSRHDRILQGQVFMCSDAEHATWCKCSCVMDVAKQHMDVVGRYLADASTPEDAAFAEKATGDCETKCVLEERRGRK